MIYQQPAHFWKRSPNVLPCTDHTNAASSRRHPAGVCTKSAPGEISKSDCSAFTFDLFPNQNHVVFLFYSIPSLTISSSATNAFYSISAPHVFQSQWDLWNLTGKAKYLFCCLNTNYLQESFILQVVPSVSHESEYEDKSTNTPLTSRYWVANFIAHLIKLGSLLEFRNVVLWIVIDDVPEHQLINVKILLTNKNKYGFMKLSIYMKTYVWWYALGVPSVMLPC